MGLLSCLIANPFAYAISFFIQEIKKGESDGYVFEDVAKPFKKKLCLPHWCSIIAWIISLLIMTVSFIIIWGYAISFGKDKVHQWMTSVVVSLLVDLLLFESLKVIIIAVFRSCLKKPIDLDSTDICDREILPQISTSDAWRKPEENNSYFEPYNKLTLEKLKSHRVSDVNIMAVIRDMIYYFVFLAVIVIISYGNMDTNSYLLKWNIEQRFIYDNQFDQVTNTVEWWKWAHSTILPKLRASNFYNGKPPFGLRGFLDDQVNRIMGYATLRQIRVKPNSCRVSPIVSNLTRNCAPAANIFFEDSRHYCDNWAERTDLTFDLPSCQRPEFRYENASSLQSLSYNAIMDTYSGGGYVVHLKGSSAKISHTLLLLQDLNWINNHTRAVFLEFSVYNANSNLFGIVTIIAEFFPGGGIRPFWRIDPVKLFKHYDFVGIFELICEGIFVLVILYFTAKEMFNIKKLKGNYFKGYWFIGEWVVIFSAYVAIGLYIYRLMLSHDILKIFGRTYGNGYVKFQLLGLADEYFIYFMGIIVFVCTLKVMKLLQFNRKFSVITMTLNRCWEDLKGFFVVFFFAFFAFVHFFYIILHSEIFDFHTLINAFETCFTMLLNKFKFGTLNQTSMTAAVMFFVFSFTCTWVLINVLITIIIEGFEQVKSDIVVMKNDLEILEFLNYRTAVLSGKKDRIVHEIMRPKDSIKTEPEVDYTKDEDGNEEDPLYLLSDKVDEFVRFVDNVYFEGSLNVPSHEIHLVDTEPYLEKSRSKIYIS
nr:polycystic kidney disease 2-like 2 protein [Lepeophtheirus salmonis]